MTRLIDREVGWEDEGTKNDSYRVVGGGSKKNRSTRLRTSPLGIEILVRTKFLFFSRIKSTITVGYPIGSTWHNQYLKRENTYKQKVYAKFIPK